MKKIALINDLSGFGKCSLTAAISVVSVMGIQAVPLPTAVLTAQTGFESFYCDDFTEKMDYFTDEWKKMGESFDGIHSGYVASPKQIEKLQRFLDVFQTDETIYLADPVMGDNGRHFKVFSDALLCGMRQLCLRANVTTPNLTELCLLTGESYDALTAKSGSDNYLEYIEEISQGLLSQMQDGACVLVTGIKRETKNGVYVGNLAVGADTKFYQEMPLIPKSFSGTGDLFASVICACLVNGLTVEDAIKKASDFLQPAIEDAMAQGVASNHGVCFEKYLGMLIER